MWVSRKSPQVKHTKSPPRPLHPALPGTPQSAAPADCAQHLYSTAAQCSLLLSLPKPSHRKPLCRLRRERKGGRDFSLPPCRLQGERKAQPPPPNSSGQVQASGGPSNTGFSLQTCTGQHCLIMSELHGLLRIWQHNKSFIFGAFSSTCHFCLFREGRSPTFKATHASH